MLDQPDRAVVCRDDGIPGLGAALDPEAVAQLLEDRVPALRAGSIAHLTANYTRYKPGANCLVGYDLTLDDGRQLPLQVKALGGPDDPKLRKASGRKSIQSALGPDYVVDVDRALVVSFFPNDAKLHGLWRWFAPREAVDMSRRIVRQLELPYAGEVSLEPLAYKPERRYVARLVATDGRSLAVLKTFRRGSVPSPRIRRFLRRFDDPADRTPDQPRVPKELTRDEKRAWLALEWLEGRDLRAKLGGHQAVRSDFEAVGCALASLHAARAGDLPVRVREGKRLSETIELVEALAPELGPRLRRVAVRVQTSFDDDPEYVPTHGDFYAKQVLCGPSVAFLDFDRAGIGEAGWDLGCFLGHLDRDRLRGMVRPERAAVAEEALLSAYSRRQGSLPPDLDAHRALALLRMAADPFRKREPEWDQRIAEIIGEAAKRITRRSAKPFPVRAPGRCSARRDAELPLLDRALEPKKVERAIAAEGGRQNVSFHAAELLRHKPGRRALIAYDVEPGSSGAATGHSPGEPPHEVWLGKLRHRGVDRRALALSRELWHRGFAAGTRDGVEVPQPLGACESLGIWFQRQVPGVPVESLLHSLDPSAHGRRLATAFHKLHSCPVSVSRLHTLSDEMNGLRLRLEAWQREDSRRATRIQRLIEASLHAANRLGPSAPGHLVHRDLHPGQVLIGRDGRVWLVDLDLCARGDPALDIGNFVAHLIEVGLRDGDPDRHAELGDCLTEAWWRSGELGPRGHVELYTQLSLARLAALSCSYADRRHTTDLLLEFALERASQPLQRTA